MNDEMIDITNKDSAEQETLLTQGGVNSMTVSGSGVFLDSASEATLEGKFDSATLTNYQFLVPDFGTYTGAFQLTLEYAGEFNGEITYSFTFESSGAITFATVWVSMTWTSYIIEHKGKSMEGWIDLGTLEFEVPYELNINL